MRWLYSICLLLTSTVFCHTNALFGQKAVYFSMQSFDEKDGYQSFSGPLYVTQDNKGLLWMGSDNGLFCFDGTHFKHFHHDPAKSNSLPFNLASFNYQDKQGVYWVHIAYKGLYHFNPKDGSFVPFTYGNQQVFDINKLPVRVPMEDKDGQLWFPVPGYGIAKWNREQNELTPFKICPEKNWGEYYSTSWVTQIIEDTVQNTFWISTNEGLVNFFPQSGNYVIYKDDPVFAATGDSVGNIFNQLYIDANHRLWAGTWNRGIKTFDIQQKTFKEFHWQSVNSSGTRNVCSGIVPFDKENLWVASLDKGLMLFDVRTEKFTPIGRIGTEEMPIDLTIFQGRQQVLWAFNQKQLLRINPAENYFPYYSLATNTADPKESAVKAFLRKGNVLYYGTNNLGHFWKYDFATGASMLIPLSNALGDQSVNSLREDNDGIIWIASRAGTYLYNPATGKISQPALLRQESELFTYPCTEILHDQDGTQWLATSEGLFHIDRKVGTADYFSASATGKRRLKGNWVVALYQDKKGDIWVGSYLHGLACYRKDKDEIVYIDNVPGLEFSYQNCPSITETEDGTILFILEYFGLGILEKPFATGQKISLLNSAQGLPSDYMLRIFKDSRAQFWLFTANGLCCVDPVSKKSIAFDKDDGLWANSWDSKPYQDSAGNMYIGFNNGFQTFRPDSLLRQVTFPVKIHLSSFLVNGREWVVDMNTVAPLVLNHDQTNIVFNFAALSPTLNHDFQYAYKMDGLEERWVHTGEKASGYYSNLPPGNYTLRIKAFDHNGNPFKEHFALPLQIKPPWYQTWWFYMLISFIILSILCAFYRYRIHSLMQVEKIRMRIATDLHDDIGSTLTSISYYSELVKMGLKEDDAMLKPVLDKIGDNARNMVSAMSDIVWLINPKNDTTANLINRMKNYAAEMLGIRNILYHFHYNAEAASLQLDMQQRKNIYLIYKEAIHNVVKYAQCSEVHITFLHTGQQLCLEVKDNGKGFETEKIHHGGNGLVNMQNRAAEIGAQLHIHAAPCAGATVALTCKIP